LAQGDELFSPDFEKQLITLCSTPDDKLANDIFTRLFQKLESAKSFREEEASRAHIILWLADTNCGLDAILEASRSKNYGVRQLATGLLTRNESQRALQRLIELFKDPTKDIDEEKMLAAAQEENIQESIEQLRKSYAWAIRQEILEVFARYSDEQITELLLDRFESASGKEKIRVAYMLSKRMGSKALPFVLPLLEDKGYDNSVVLSILSHIGGEQVEQILLNALDKGYSLYTVVQCLHRTGTGKSVPALAQAFERPMHKNVRILIIKTLGRIGCDEAVYVLASWLNKAKYRLFVVRALGNSGNPLAVNIILNFLGCEDIEQDWSRWRPRRKYGLTAACVRALGSLGSSQAIPMLKKFVNSESHEVRLEAFAALAKLDDRECIENIYPFLDLESEEFANLDAKVYLGKTDKPEERKRPLRERAVEILMKSESPKAARMVLKYICGHRNERIASSILHRALDFAGPRVVPILLEFVQERDLKQPDLLTWDMIYRLALYKDSRAVNILKRAYRAYDPRISHHFGPRTVDVQKVISQALTKLTGKECKYFYMIPFE